MSVTLGGVCSDGFAKASDRRRFGLKEAQGPSLIGCDNVLKQVRPSHQVYGCRCLDKLGETVDHLRGRCLVEITDADRDIRIQSTLQRLANVIRGPHKRDPADRAVFIDRDKGRLWIKQIHGFEDREQTVRNLLGIGVSRRCEACGEQVRACDGGHAIRRSAGAPVLQVFDKLPGARWSEAWEPSQLSIQARSGIGQRQSGAFGARVVGRKKRVLGCFHNPTEVVPHRDAQDPKVAVEKGAAGRLKINSAHWGARSL